MTSYKARYHISWSTIKNETDNIGLVEYVYEKIRTLYDILDFILMHVITEMMTLLYIEYISQEWFLLYIALTDNPDFLSICLKWLSIDILL